MSVSAFHRQFKAVTNMSPLQFQKTIRLMHARRLMVTEALSAASVSIRVGYESPSQFSREYSRLFGQSPVRDTADLIGAWRSAP
jgi:AraC-like DNA-binding protein